MSKLKKFSIWIGVFFVLGFIMSMLKHSGYWMKLMAGFSAIPWYLYFIFIIVAFFLVILVHELGHLISFVFSGIKIRALYVLIFVVKKTKKGWNFQIYLPLIKILGGLVVPDLPEISNDAEYDVVVGKFSKALIAGPVASIGYFVLSLIGFILAWFLPSNAYLLGLLAINIIVVMILTVFVMIASSLSTDTMYGDFVARRKIVEDDLFQMNQIIQYISFSLQDHTASNVYLINKLEDYYKTGNTGYDLFSVTLLMQYISMILKAEDYIEKPYLTAKINSLRITRLASSKHGIELAYLIAAYKYLIGDIFSSYETYFLTNNNKNSHHEKSELAFYKLHYAHLLNINDHSFYFKSLDNLYLGDLWLLKPIFNEEEILSDLLHQLPIGEYVMELYCNI